MTSGILYWLKNQIVNHIMKHNKQPRRVFLKNAFSTGLAITGLTGIAASCTGNTDQEEKTETPAAAPESPSAASTDDCKDFSQVPQAEIEKRKSLGYEEVTPFTDKQCDNCQLFIPPKEGHTCGGCMLFKGPVYAEAHCTYWAPQTDA